MTNLNELQEVITQTNTLLETRNELTRAIAVLEQSKSDKNAPAMWLRLLPGRIAATQKRLIKVQEQIDFNIAYCEMEATR